MCIYQKYQNKTFQFTRVRMHEGKCLSQLDKGKFTLLEMQSNDDKWRYRECFWSSLSDCTSSYIEVTMFFFLFPDSNRFYYSQYTKYSSFILYFFFKWLGCCLVHSIEKIVGHHFWNHLGFQHCNGSFASKLSHKSVHDSIRGIVSISGVVFWLKVETRK